MINSVASPREKSQNNLVWFRFGASVTILIIVAVYSGAIDAEIRVEENQRRSRARPGGYSVFLAWPKMELPLILAFVCSAFLVPKHHFRPHLWAIYTICTLVLGYGSIVHKVFTSSHVGGLVVESHVGGLVVAPHMALTWIEFSSRHGCQIQREPAINLSLTPYRDKCKGVLSNTHVQQAVKRSNSIGISITNTVSTVGGGWGQSQVAVFGSEEAKNRDHDRLWHDLVVDLQTLAESVQLPSVNFAVHLGDGWSSDASDCIPMFVQEKYVHSSGGILAPSRSTNGIFDRSRRDYLYDKNVKIATRAHEVEFTHKKDMAFFRGSTTGGLYTSENWKNFQRSKIVQVSLKRPDLLDARFTVNTQADAKAWEEMVAHNFTGAFVKQEVDATNYKMVVVPDGNSVPDRLMSLLAANVVVLKPSSVNEEYWYRELVPWEHYIPFKQDVSDLESVLEEAIVNKSRLEYIARQSTLFVLERLNPSTVACYWGLLLHEYATLQNT